MNDKGFTLIEIIAVLAIISVIAGVAVSRMGGFDDEANAVVTTYNETAEERIDNIKNLMER